MGKGLGAGLVSGGFVGAVVLSMLSLYAPLPQERIDAAPKLEAETPTSQTVAPEADGVSVTPATEKEAIKPAVEPPAIQPETETEATIEAPSAEQVETIAPAEEAKAVTPANETETAAQAESAAATQIADSETTISPQTELAEAPVVTPATGTPAMPEAVQPQTSAPKVEAIATAVAPAQTQNPASVPAESSGDTLSASDTGVTTEPVTPQVQEAAVAQVPKLEGADTAIVQRSAAPSETVVGQEQIVETSEEPDTPPRRKLPTIGNEELETVSADRPITAPVPEITNPVAGVVTGRLPTLGAPSPQPASVTEEAPVEDAAPIENDALRQFAAPVDGIEDKALFSVLLIDSGADGVPRDQLARLAVPVTIALDPTAPNAAQIMADYRAAGVEVVAIANDLPVASEPSDVAVSISAYFEVLDQVVGLMDPLDGRIQGNRSLLQPVLGAIRDTGHGLITYDRGLNTAQQAARRESIPSATIFRILDGELEEAPKIKRYLDRAAFTANQDGSVVVVGRSYDETVKAIVEWALEKKDASIAMVPVSAIMLDAQNS